ncbi:MAG: phosphate acyltransferase PlsX [Acidiferrobacteraceae bacterium]
MPITLALDAMGGDHGVSVVVPAALAALAKYPDLTLILVGREEAMRSELNRLQAVGHPRLVLKHAPQVVTMADPPALAVRAKKESSMRVAINLVKDEEADACVSAGNTGALMAMAHFVLKMLPGIERPAIVTSFPNVNGHIRLLDLGANIDCTAQQLLQFATMGSILAAATEGLRRPSVGLLNVGTEAIKGNDLIKEASRLLEESGLNYVGYVEGDAIYTGTTDVIVCNGFVGNVALKTSEGLAQMVSHTLKSAFNRNLLTRLSGLAARPVLNAFRRRVDHRRYNGASFIGLNGTVIKSRGSADVVAFGYAIEEAISEVTTQVPQHIRNELAPSYQGTAP